MLLFTCERTRGFRASWTAAELGLALDYRMLPFPPRICEPDYLNENPLGTVPMLVDGDVRLTESSAICQYLAAQCGDTPLIVRPDEADYGPYLDFLHYADATLTFPQTVYMRFALFEKERGLAEAGAAYARWFGARLAKVEERLEGRDYLCAERFTIADIAVSYALWLAQMVELDEFFRPNVAYYIERQRARPAFRSALDCERTAGKGVAPSFMDHMGGLNRSAEAKID